MPEDNPLHTMRGKKMLEALKCLVENGAKVNSICEFGFTSLFYACAIEQVEMVK